MSVSVWMNGVWNHHKSDPYSEFLPEGRGIRWQASESHGWRAWPLMGQSLFHGPYLYLKSLRQKPGAQRHTVQGGLQCPKRNSEDEQWLVPLPHQGLAHGGLWESIHLAHALTFSQRESAAVASNINSMEKYGGGRPGMCIDMCPHHPSKCEKDIFSIIAGVYYLLLS